MKLEWRLKGETYHNNKVRFKDSFKPLGFKYISKWNDPSAVWKSPDGTTVTGKFVRTEIDGKEVTLQATIILEGEDIEQLTKSFNSIFGVEGKAPESPKSKMGVPDNIKLQYEVWHDLAWSNVIYWDESDKALGYPMSRQSCDTFVRLARKKYREEWEFIVTEIKKEFPKANISVPEWLQ